MNFLTTAVSPCRSSVGSGIPLDRHRRHALPGSLLAVFLTESGAIGSEFLPHLDEGAIWVRGTLAPSTGPTEGDSRHG